MDKEALLNTILKDLGEIETMVKTFQGQQNIPAAFRRFFGGTSVDVSQSDIRAVVRAELKSLRSSLRNARGGDSMSRIHIADALERVNNILDPK